MNLNHINIEYLVIAMAAVILYLPYYAFTKDAQYSKNIRSVATVAEELNREIFYLKKKLSEAQLSLTQKWQPHERRRDISRDRKNRI